jgi:hypothetical protein
MSIKEKPIKLLPRLLNKSIFLKWLFLCLIFLPAIHANASTRDNQPGRYVEDKGYDADWNPDLDWSYGKYRQEKKSQREQRNDALLKKLMKDPAYKPQPTLPKDR